MTACPATGAGDPPRPRLYRTVSLGQEGGRFRLLLDGKPARTPLRRVLETRARALAQTLVEEWDGQHARIDPHSMPMTRLLATALDRVGPEREAVIAALLRHIDSDVVCYRAEGPPALCAREDAAWQPVLAWLAAALGITLIPTVGVMPRAQPASAADAMACAIRALDRDRLTAFQACAGASGSLALALALVHGRLSAAEVHAAALVDEFYQTEQWGGDAQAAARRAAIGRDIAAAGAFLRLVNLP